MLTMLMLLMMMVMMRMAMMMMMMMMMQTVAAMVDRIKPLTSAQTLLLGATTPPDLAACRL